ncbi:hypothetical protein LIA77_08500 [Sarocladium implicatum]|nr:hypothetical protein LIA77_08500 [Sarocladium implicatum]
MPLTLAVCFPTWCSEGGARTGLPRPSGATRDSLYTNPLTNWPPPAPCAFYLSGSLLAAADSVASPPPPRARKSSLQLVLGLPHVSCIMSWLSQCSCLCILGMKSLTMSTFAHSSQMNGKFMVEALFFANYANCTIVEAGRHARADAFSRPRQKGIPRQSLPKVPSMAPPLPSSTDLKGSDSPANARARYRCSSSAFAGLDVDTVDAMLSAISLPPLVDAPPVSPRGNPISTTSGSSALCSSRMTSFFHPADSRRPRR